MRIYCEAILDNDLQRDNLIQCIEILGGKPVVRRDKVCIDYGGDPSTAEKFIQLFEQYSRHSIVTLS